VIQFVHQRQQAAHASVATASAPPGAAHFAQPGQAGLGAAALPRSGPVAGPRPTGLPAARVRHVLADGAGGMLRSVLRL